MKKIFLKQNCCQMWHRLKGSRAPGFPIFSRSLLANDSFLFPLCNLITHPDPFLIPFSNVCILYVCLFFFFSVTTLKKYKTFEMGLFILLQHSILLNLLSLSTAQFCWELLNTCSTLPLSWLHSTIERSWTLISLWK